MTDKIYPEVHSDLIENGDINKYTAIAQTNLRVQDKDGKWYLSNIEVSLSSNKPDGVRKYHALERLHVEVYSRIISGVVNLELLTSEGDPVFILDENQQDEPTRVYNSMVPIYMRKEKI